MDALPTSLGVQGETLQQIIAAEKSSLREVIERRRAPLVPNHSDPL
jgi:hypothetical protein